MGRVHTAGAGALALLMATTWPGTWSARPAHAARAEPAATAASGTPTLLVSPAAGRNVPPGGPVTVAIAGGALQNVTVTDGGAALPGVLGGDRTRWRSTRPTLPGRTYQVRVVTADGAARTFSFATAPARATFGIKRLLPDETTGLTVGVGMPIMITFDQDVTDRASVERNLFVYASRPVVGAWHWFDDRTIAYRPKEFWPARTKVRVVARLHGVPGGEGRYGDRDYRRDFEIGRAQITTGSIRTHHMTVRRDGKAIRTIPFSAGRGGVMKYHTTSGVHLAMSREAVTVMTSPDAAPGQPGYYRLTVYDTVRISDSGEYVHGAPWSVGSQGRANVSHGCVNISPANAKWFRKETLIGDPIILTGSPRRLEPLNGWGHWQLSWDQWLKWSVLRDATTEPL